jgi:hypothetical protein
VSPTCGHGDYWLSPMPPASFQSDGRLVPWLTSLPARWNSTRHREARPPASGIRRKRL